MKRTRWIAPAIGAALVIFGTAIVWGQDVGSTLQGRLLVRSDGTLYVYRDGLKYAVQPADVGDDVIDAIPTADAPVAQLDQLFASTRDPGPAVEPPAPVAPPAPVIQPGPYIAVNNPSPGDILPAGGLAMQGKAFDPVANVDQATGVDRVQVFLEDRDRGGMFLGDARLGLPNLAAESGSQFALAGWEITVTLPSGNHLLFVYARSSVTGKESTVSIPVRVGRGS
jgi:hypothetical protein